jgi:osmotically-inducible protein OsmY
LVVAVVAVGCAPSDADTSTKVKANLTADANVKTAAIDVGVEKKVVTLTGTVDTEAIKARAVVVARGTDGVGEIVDHLVVKPQGFGPEHGREMMGREMGEHGVGPNVEKRP